MDIRIELNYGEYKAVVYNSNGKAIGWIRLDQLEDMVTEIKSMNRVVFGAFAC